MRRSQCVDRAKYETMRDALLLVLPMVILFAIFQRYFIQGISTQGRKG